MHPAVEVWQALAAAATAQVTPVWVIVAGVLAGFVAIVGGLGGLGAVVYRLAKPQLVHWLQLQVVHPLQETHHQVTQNGGEYAPKSDRTLRDTAERAAMLAEQVQRRQSDHEEWGQKVMASALAQAAEQGLRISIDGKPEEGEE